MRIGFVFNETISIDVEKVLMVAFFVFKKAHLKAFPFCQVYFQHNKKCDVIK